MRYDQTIDFMNRLIDEEVMPGVSYAFIEATTIEKGLLGKKQVYPNTLELEEDTLYDMASLTKMIGTNSILLQLLENKQIEIDTPLNHYLPEWKDERVTIRHLLTHTSDINPYIPKRDQLNKRELRDAILSLKPGDRIGENVVYTDTGTILLGFMIEKLYRGKKIQEVMKDEVLTPLGMTDSCFLVEEPSKVAPTEVTTKRGVIKGSVHDPKAYVLGSSCGSAGLFSTLDDSIRFAQMMLHKGMLENGKRLFREETILGLLSDYTPNQSGKRSLGWDLIENGPEQPLSLYHTGYTGTFMILDIINKSAFIFLSNRVHPVDNKDHYLIKRECLIDIYQKEKTK